MVKNVRELEFIIWMTSDCNLKCDYCYEGEKFTTSMSDDTIKNTINFIKKLLSQNNSELCSIRFHGGEPLIYPQKVVKIVTELNALKMKTRFIYSITTNGYSINEKTKLFLSEKFDYISFSIDGKATTHDAHRKTLNGNPTFQNSFENAKELLKSCNIAIRMTVVKDSVENVFENVLFFINEGFTNISPILDTYNTKWTEEDLIEYERQLRKIRNEIYKSKRKAANVYLATISPFMKKSPCGGGVTNFHISPLGQIYPCSLAMGDSTLLCGDVSTGIDPKWKSRLEEISTLEISECSGCNFKESCTANRCRIINYKLTGHFNKPSELICAVENIRFSMNNIKESEY